MELPKEEAEMEGPEARSEQNSMTSAPEKVSQNDELLILVEIRIKLRRLHTNNKAITIIVPVIS